jgi:hypothetical protein
MIMLLKGNLQMFGEDEMLDLDSELAAFEAEWQDEEVEVEEESTEAEQEADQEVEEVEETQEETPQADPNDSDAEKRNRAFADLRRQADENRKYAEFIQRLADESGVKPDDLLARYEERKLQTDAQKQNVPVEFLKESRDTAQRLSQLEERTRAERLETQIDAVSSKYGANEDSIRAAFAEMLDAGIDPRVQDNVNFEKFYRAANLDSIIQKEVENARQKDLENKKKRQESASVPNGSSVSPSSGDMSDEEFEAELKRLGMSI